VGTTGGKSKGAFRLLLGWSTGSFVVLFVLGNLAIGAGALLGSIYRWVAASPWHLLPSIGVVVVLGHVAFELRKRHRRHYGALEVGAAAATFVHVLAHPVEPLAETAALVAAVYFYVRGLDSVYAGAAEDSKE
jgi:hypothetical protein